MNKHIINDFYQELGLSGVQEFLTRREKKGGVPYIVLKEGFLEACRRKDIELVVFLKDQVKPNLHEKGMFHLVSGGRGMALEKAFDLFPTYPSMNHEVFFQEFVRRGKVNDSQTMLSLCKSISPVSVFIFLTHSSHKENQEMFEGMMDKLVIPKQTVFDDFGLILKQAGETQFDQLLGKVKDTLWFMEHQPLLASFCLDLVDYAYSNHNLFEKAKKLTPFIARDQLEKEYHEKHNSYHHFEGGFSQAILMRKRSKDGSYIKSTQVQEILRLIDKHALQREMDGVIAQKEGEPRSPSRKRM